MRASRRSLPSAPLALIACLTFAASAHAQSADTQVHINQIQVIGTHNSYHAGIPPSERKLLEATHPDVMTALDYAHPPLTVQFNAGVRQIELDVFADTKGGLYAHPSEIALVAGAHLPPDTPFDPEGIMLKPGFKVMHVQDIDVRSNCQPFIACLTEVRTWTKAHPNAAPIFILVETKQGKPRPELHMTEPEPFTSATFDALDAEIRSVFSPAEMISPDDVRGHAATLNEAVLAGGWPTLASARGKVIFLMDQRNVGPVYLEGHAALRGRAIFTNAVLGAPDAAFTEMNSGPAAEIADAVRKGYLVRARTDSDTKEARTNATATRDAMLASGAQILSTDYPINEPARFDGHFSVTLPDHREARCDPQNAPASCKDTLFAPLP